MKREVIAVDGEAASGKSACALLAKKLGYALLGTGVIYRTITLMVWRAGIDQHNTELVSEYVKRNFGRLSFCGDQLMFNDEPVGDEVNTDVISVMTPDIAKIPDVRSAIVPLQRSFNDGHRIVVEGRDIGSVIFPDARIKFFLTARLEVRAMRRWRQYQETDPESPSFKAVLNELRLRDHKDYTRSDSPLIRLPDAIVIDTSDLTKEEVVEKMLEMCHAQTSACH